MPDPIPTGEATELPLDARTMALMEVASSALALQVLAQRLMSIALGLAANAATLEVA